MKKRRPICAPGWISIPREPARDLREGARREEPAVLPQPVMDAIPPQRVQSGVEQHDLQPRARRGIALQHRGNVFAHEAEVRNHSLYRHRLSRLRRHFVAQLLEEHAAQVALAERRAARPRSACRHSPARSATRNAATTAAPDEMPISRPSSTARRRAMTSASSLEPARLRRCSRCAECWERSPRRCPESCAARLCRRRAPGSPPAQPQSP